MKFLKSSGMLLALGAVGANAAIVFQDDFSTDTSANYVVYRRNATSTSTAKPLDSNYAFSFDHSVAWPWDGLTYTGTDPGLPIPPAPGASDSKALYFRVNTDLAETTTVESIIAAPLGIALVGDYTMTVDVWCQVTTSGTSTQLGLAGGNMQGKAGWMQTDGGTGYMFSWVVDGSSSRDYRQYVGPSEWASAAGTNLTVGGTWYAPTGNGGTGTWSQQNNNNDYYDVNLFPTTAGYKYGGAPAGKWVRLRVQRVGTEIKYSFADPAVGTYTDICSMPEAVQTYTGGFPVIGMWDPAASPRPADQPLFILFDNLVVDGTLGSAVSGTYQLSDWSGDYPAKPSYEVFDELNQIVVDSGTVQIDEVTKKFNLVVPQGNYTLRFLQYGHWTGASYAYDTTSGPVNNVTMTLWNGDIDKDNVISVFDYILLSDAFDSVADQDGDPNTIDPSPNWLADADLDNDGVISVFDYIILSDNFDKSGGW